MNWTGGRLSRHSRNANGSLTKRQKQHFARARSNLLNGPRKRSPFRVSIFEVLEAAAREQGRKPHPTPHPVRRSRPGSSLNSEKSCKRSHRSQTSLQGNKQPCQERESFGEVLSDDRSDHDARPPSDVGIGRNGGFIVETANTNCEADSLEERRRKILRRLDWVGANIQHPIKLRFTASGSDERLGKRRAITERHQNQFDVAVKSRITSPFRIPRSKQKPRGSPGAQGAIGNSNGALSKNHVRISIGGRHVVTGVASSISDHKPVGGRFASSQASVSAEMLLDADDISKRHRHIPQEKQEYLSSPASPPFPYAPEALSSGIHRRKRALSPYGRSNGANDRYVVNSPADHQDGIHTPQTGQNNFPLTIAQYLDKRVDNWGHTSGQQIEPEAKSYSSLVTLRSPSVRHFSAMRSRKRANITQISDQGTNPMPSFSPNVRYITDITGQLPESTQKLQSVPLDKSGTGAQINSRPELLHPIPLTLRTSRVLRDASSEEGSDVAQIGVEPAASRSQILDEDIWKTWVLSAEECLSNESDNGMSDAVSISPGISNFAHRHARRSSIIANETGTKDVGTVLRVGDGDGTCEKGIEQSGVQTVEKESDPGMALPELQEDAHFKKFISKDPAIDYRTLFRSRPRKLPTPPPKPQPAREDEAWMKFILSDDDNDPEESTSQPPILRQVIPASPIQRPSTSSMVGHVSAGTTSPISSTARPNNVSNETNSSLSLLSNDTRNTSNHTTQDSDNPPSSSSSHGRPSSVDLISTHCPTSPSRSGRQLTFTKPPRYRGLNHRSSSPENSIAAATARSPVHIGKSFSRIAKLRDRKRSSSSNDGIAAVPKRRKTRHERDIKHGSRSGGDNDDGDDNEDSDGDEIESIEDD